MGSKRQAVRTPKYKIRESCLKPKKGSRSPSTQRDVFPRSGIKDLLRKLRELESMTCMFRKRMEPALLQIAELDRNLGTCLMGFVDVKKAMDIKLQERIAEVEKLNVNVAAKTTVLERRLNTVTGRLKDSEARVDFLEERLKEIDHPSE